MNKSNCQIRFNKLNILRRILHIAPTLGGGGAEILLGHIVLEQLNKGYSVEIVIVNELHFTYDNYPFKKEFDERVKLHFIQLESKFSIFRFNFILNNYQKFRDLISDFKPDVIHSHLYQGEFFAHYEIFENIKYVSHLHDNMVQFNLSEIKGIKNKLINFLEVRFLKRKYIESNSKFISISKDTTNYFKVKLPQKVSKNIIQLPNATNLSMYFSNSNKLDSKEKLKLVSVGNLTQKKAHEFLIDVVDHLINRLNINVTLDILGFGARYDELNKIIQEKGLSSQIILHGNVKNVSEFLSLSHIYVHSALYEPFGMVFIEAMASSLPIVSLDGRGNVDLIIDDYNGYFIKSRDVSKFTEAIVKIYKNDLLRKRLGENSKILSEKYDIKNYVNALDLIYFN